MVILRNPLREGVIPVIILFIGRILTKGMHLECLIFPVLAVDCLFLRGRVVVGQRKSPKVFSLFRLDGRRVICVGLRVLTLFGFVLAERFAFRGKGLKFNIAVDASDCVILLDPAEGGLQELVDVGPFVGMRSEALKFTTCSGCTEGHTIKDAGQPTIMVARPEGCRLLVDVGIIIRQVNIVSATCILAI